MSESRDSGLEGLRIGYLIPEFPGQTHIWMWREIEWTRRWAEFVHIYSTRAPSDRDRARHAFAKTSQPITTTLWPGPVVGPVVWAAVTRPVGLLGAVQLCFTLPIDKRPAALELLKLVPSACYLSKEVVRNKLNHVHSHSCASSAVLAMMVRRITGVPFSLTLNANVEWWGGAMAEKFKDAKFTLAITEWLLDQCKKSFPELAPDQLLLGRIGVDTTSWPAKQECEPLQGRPARLLTVARLHSSKGHDDLIRALGLLVAQGRDIQLRMVGDGPQRAELEEQVNSSGLKSRVTFTGSLAEDQIKDEMRQADVFALASHAEPLGVVYMEAMASGVPTVGTNAGGVGEIITSGEDGLLVEPKNPKALADAIAHILDNPDVWKKLALNGRRTIVERFDSRIGAATLFRRATGRDPKN
ncbi:MAG TPA: glycosyltransferase family 4 protein [Polyangiaceae bacterium]|nr:glycosyltransferase family 4 protein [Polyangiaceae bacterium]